MKIPRRVYLADSRDQSSDSRCVNPQRQMAKRAKRQGSKRLRATLKRQLPKDST